jgi:RNA polymerase subunit RPABC4/transcription elongation factor Spt4
MVEICPACKGKDLENFWPGDFGNVYRCRNCETIIEEDFGGHNGHNIEPEKEMVHRQVNDR